MIPFTYSSGKASGNGIAAAGQWQSGGLSDRPNHNSGRKKIQAKWMYDADGNLDKNHLVEAYAPLVKRIAYHLMAKLPASVHIDDVIQNGMVGLLDAIGRYEDGLGAQFETYAVQRIRGAMLDGLRENDWLPRSMRRDMRRIESAIHSLEQQNGRPPTEIELAESMGMPLADYQRMLQDARGHQLVYFEDFTDEEGEDYFERHLGEHESNPADLFEQANMRSALVKAIDDLPEREKLMMALYYDEELNLREIGEVLGVSESRVCQLHSQAVARLRSRVMGTPAPGSGTGARRGRPPKTPAAGA
ncbi:RNA polymerase factor sigma-28 subunit [Azoarcus sp. KH32C]|nr:RNA polymerase factor sigma-28 subunit [Azoarcus sp. KH32C]